ncbi:hypothetical protein D6853_11300 [Butyrivibrio sp. X503]|uniref:hypothetical protein n=1 Tax=Butyrivibrio sp. X503 TaxID=2364878 RepID=UPI000EA87511|nr:hypothetical protein [Butyrivibrio sp. X503]RKM55297.1 hypothetical protein D6853_11300 [Butyrivibrio sp. X503]
MKKRGVQLATGLIFAGMVAMTGCGSAQTTDTEAPETTGVETEAPATEVAEPDLEAPAADVPADEDAVEEVEVPMEENESALSGSGETGTITKFKTLKELEQSLTKKQGFAYLNVQGANASVIAVIDAINGGGTRPVKFYTQKSGENKVYYAGTLTAHDFMISRNGVIYASLGRTYETYFLSTDGRSLEHKDYIERGEGEKTKTAYFRENNTSPKVYRDTSAREFEDMQRQFLDNEKEIKFTKGTK